MSHSVSIFMIVNTCQNAQSTMFDSHIRQEVSIFMIKKPYQCSFSQKNLTLRIYRVSMLRLYKASQRSFFTICNSHGLPCITFHGHKDVSMRNFHNVWLACSTLCQCSRSKRCVNVDVSQCLTRSATMCQCSRSKRRVNVHVLENSDSYATMYQCPWSKRRVKTRFPENYDISWSTSYYGHGQRYMSNLVEHNISTLMINEKHQWSCFTRCQHSCYTLCHCLCSTMRVNAHGTLCRCSYLPSSVNTHFTRGRCSC